MPRASRAGAVCNEHVHGPQHAEHAAELFQRAPACRPMTCPGAREESGEVARRRMAVAKKKVHAARTRRRSFAHGHTRVQVERIVHQADVLQRSGPALAVSVARWSIRKGQHQLPSEDVRPNSTPETMARKAVVLAGSPGCGRGGTTPGGDARGEDSTRARVHWRLRVE